MLERDAYGSSTHFTTFSYLLYILWVVFVFVSVLIAVYAKLYPMQYMLAKVCLLTITVLSTGHLLTRLLTITAHCLLGTY